MDKGYFYQSGEVSTPNHKQANGKMYYDQQNLVRHAEDNVNEGSVEIIKDKLYFLSADIAP